ncbi:peptidase family M1-domain-containing protein [Mycena vulgaris]|nr:peptidase family M1-domain-containing protein [Mycena vulgaris]
MHYLLPTMDSTALDTYRLPILVTPLHYDLKIRTDLEALSFDGAVEVAMMFDADTASIVLNAFELELGAASLVVGQETLRPTSQQVNADTQRVTLSFEKVFTRGSHAVLRMTFSGKLQSLFGYFKSEWVHDGKTEYTAATFFEPTYARRAFPCWDEPALKATFAISLISRVGTINLSNMPVYLEGPYDPAQDPLEPAFGAGNDAAGWIITRFETTPKMSTYIVAFANGPFVHLEGAFTSPLSGRVCPVKVYATPDLIAQGRFSVDLMTRVLPILETMFDLEYPLPKMDIVNTPGAFGALENWGLIVGEPGAFLFDPATGATATQKRVVYTTSHELAHQWFGNIVTMEWWDNLWLNEGTSGMLYPEWNTPAAFVNTILKPALTVDAKLSSHPVQVECPDANYVNEIMDMISYRKSASLLRMLSNLLGEATFFKGVSMYLKERQFGNSVAADLWDALGRASGTDVLGLMENWITKMGYPVLTVTEAPGGINVCQNRFLASGIADAHDDETIWTVPLNLLTLDLAGRPSIDNSLFLTEREQFIPLDLAKPFKLNAASTGLYRVLYGSEHLNNMALEAAKGNICDRVGLMNDAMALAQAGLAKLSSALTLIDSFAGETEYIILEGIAANIDTLRDAWWENPDIVKQLDSLDRHIFVPLVTALGYQYHAGESTDAAAVRTLAVKRAANAGEPGVVSELQGRFSEFMTTGDASRIPPDLLSTIYTVAVRHGGREEYDRMWEILKTTKSPAVEGQVVFAIGATENSALMAETLSRLLQENDGNVDWLLYALSTHPKSRRPLVQFFKDNFDTLQARFETGGFEHYSQMPFRPLTAETDYDDTVAFFKTKDTSKFTRSLEQTLESIRTNIKFLERCTPEIGEWFESWEVRRDASRVTA